MRRSRLIPSDDQISEKLWIRETPPFVPICCHELVCKLALSREPDKTQVYVLGYYGKSDIERLNAGD